MQISPYVLVVISASSLWYADAFLVGNRRAISGNKISTREVTIDIPPFSKSSLRDKWDDLVDEDEVGDPLWQVGDKRCWISWELNIY